MTEMDGTLPTEQPHTNRVSPLMASFVAGGVAGVGAVYAGYPLDTVKVLLQTAPIPKPGEAPKYTGVFDCLSKTVRARGLTGLYRGAAAPAVPAVGMSMLVFGIFGGAQDRIAAMDPSTGGKRENLSVPQVAAAGFVAGTGISLLTAPTEMVKNRMQIGTEFKSTWQATVQISKQHGLRGLFQGYNAVFLRDGPGGAFYYGLYELIKRRMNAGSTEPASSEKLMLAGGLAGVGAWMGMWPMDVIKTRMQVQPFHTAKTRSYTGIIDCAHQLWRQEGPRGFFRGFSAGMLRAFPVNAVTWLLYEHTMRFMESL